MDYQTKSINWKKLRKLAVLLRMLFGVKEGGPFPVLEVLDHLCEIFRGCNYEVVEDHKLPSQIMAQCILNDTGGYTIEIKESIYNGAYRNHIGAYLVYA